ncbi:MAG: tetratricopeptide repeat protein [Candidatus Gastranaerophilales bacterium]|nr:tetratricopeptide repeat protein [Candidatus Gastranaerophilales bacterium]
MKKLALLFILLMTSVNADILFKIDNGIRLFNARNYDGAIRYFTSYINANPNDEDGYFWLGKTYLQQNNEKQAVSAFKKAYALAFSDKNIDKIDFENNEYDNLEDYFDMAASYYEEANYKEALNYADMMIKIDPDSSGAYFIKSKIAYIEGDKILAVEYLNKAILFNNSLLKTKLARVLGVDKVPELSKEDCALYAQKTYFKGDINASIKYLKQYLKIDENNIDIYNMLINCYLKNKNIQDAKTALIQAQKINPNNTSLMLLSAETERLENAQSDEKYKQILLKTYEINPNNRNVLLKLGNFYLDKKDYENASKYFEMLTNVDDTMYEGYFGYIYSLIKLNKTEEAQSYIKTITELNKNTSEINYLLALICYNNQEYKEALDYLNTAVQKEQNPVYFLEGGKISYILNDYALSIKYLTPIAKNPEAIEYLIASYIKTNDLDKANELIAGNSEFDKNRILYKYYLYKISKSENNGELNAILRQKPVTLRDYFDIAKVNLLEGKKDTAGKILNNANKKFHNNPELKYEIQDLQNIINSPVR